MCGSFWDCRLNVIKSTKWSEWNVVFLLESFHVCTYAYRCSFPLFMIQQIYQINEMKWEFAYFLGWNFTRPYVCVWKFLGLEMKWEWKDLNESVFFFWKAFHVCMYIKSMKWSEWICVFFCGSFSRLYARIKMFFFSVYDLTNVIKSNQIKSMKWIFVFFIWNFARPYVHVYQINEMIWMNLCFFVGIFSCLYVCV